MPITLLKSVQLSKFFHLEFLARWQLNIPFPPHLRCFATYLVKYINVRKPATQWNMFNLRGSIALYLRCVGTFEYCLLHIHWWVFLERIFSERELTFTFAICYRPSVCLSSVTLVHPTQPIAIFGNISTALGTLAIRWHPLKISRRSSQGNPSAGGVEHKRGSKI